MKPTTRSAHRNEHSYKRPWHRAYLRLSAISFALFFCSFASFDAFSSHEVLAIQSSGPATDSTRAAEPATRPPVVSRTVPSDFDRAYGALPLHFEENAGQFDDAVRFVAHSRNYTVSLTDQEARLSVCLTSQPSQSPQGVQMRLVGSRTTRDQTRAENELPGRSNYFLGNDASRWRTNVRHYGRVAYRSVYPGIDLVYYGANQSELEFDFIIAPGADPGQIRIAYEGVGELQIDPSGALILDTFCGPIRQHRPNVYQTISGVRRPVEGEYAKVGPREVRFGIGDYDRSVPVIIDPIIAASSYLGGNNMDQINHISVDGAGDVYLTGDTYSTDFPTTANAYRRTNAGDADVFVAKLTGGGTRLVYVTYFGGSGFDTGLRVVPDPYGSVYVSGQTLSSNFPTRQAAQRSKRGRVDAFLTKLGPNGDTIGYSTFLGGNLNESDEAGTGLAVDSNGNAYVAFPTLSPSMAHLTTQGAIASTLVCASCSDAYIVKLNPSGTVIYGTYFGGNVSPQGLAVDANGNAYITGSSNGFLFPLPGPAAIGSFRGGRADAFVGKINSSGTARVYATLIGGSAWDYGSAIVVDSAGQAYVVGGTNSTDFPTVGSYQANYGGGPFDGFITKVSTTGDSFVYSTFLGGSKYDVAFAVAVDSNRSAYIVGKTDSANYPVVNPLQRLAGESDAFITKVSPRGDNLIFSSFLGGGVTDWATGVATSGNQVYVTGGTDSVDFPLKQPFQAISGGGGPWEMSPAEGFITRLTEPGMYLR